MRSLVFIFCLTVSWASAQNGRGPQHLDHTGHGWDIRLAVPGEPGNDYPTLGAIPRTSFSCAGREPGYYADLETNCQVFRVCTVGSTYGFQSFLCPNGTLFNQAVFVCDWWMNVDCQNSQQFHNNNNDQFENLKLGPQLMKDIKKMLTHPMRNPYDKNSMRSKLIIMQDYKPPTGQLFPNGALLAGPERAPNNVFVPSKLINPNVAQNNFNDNTLSASTPEPRYLSGSHNNNVIPNQKDAEAFQRQRQNGQYIQNSRIQTTPNAQNGNLISNERTSRFMQNTGPSNGLVQSMHPVHRMSNTIQNAQLPETNSGRAEYTDPPRKLSQASNDRQVNTRSHVNPQNNKVLNNYQNTQQNIYSTPTSFPQFFSTIDRGAGRELKQNLVSTIRDVLSTVATKATTYIGKLPLASKVGKSKPRITIKTWIVKPTKSARLVNLMPYTYNKPTPSPEERLVNNPTPYVYERPTAPSLTENTVSTESISDSDESYIYTKPTPLPKLVTTTTKTTRLLNAPSTSASQVVFSGRLDVSPSSQPQITRVYLTPPTFTSTSRFYLPPIQNPPPLSRQYLPANIVQPPTYYSNAQLRAITNRIPAFVSFTSLNSKNSSFSLTNTSQSNITPNNLTFTDILTKKKLNTTVNDIVKDTNSILRTASPEQFNQYSSEFNSKDYVETDYLPTKSTIESGENLTSRSLFQSTTPIKSARIIATPSPSLQPPKKSLIQQSSNKLSNLPYFKESFLPNTIERTVSIKITIPERIATYLFKNQTESDFDKLEILNTGSSNYLVLSNNLLTKDKGFNFIPIVKLNGNKSPNISNSQALVYSFLADSINVAREYNNIAQQEILSTPSTPTTQQFQNLNNEQLSQITNKVSQLTSSQYSNSNLNNVGNQINTVPSHNNNTAMNHFTESSESARYTEQNQPRQASYSIIPSQQTQELYSSGIKTTSNIPNNQIPNQNQIYSGQLYQWAVPDVTDQIYNKQSSENLVNQNIMQTQNTQMVTLSAERNKLPNNFKQSSSFEVVKAETVPLHPVNQRLEPPSAPTPFSSQENLNNLLTSGSGISAQFEDKIVGTVPHALEENKVIRYKKDQSYLLYTKLEDNTIDQNVPKSTHSNVQQNTKSIHEGAPDLISVQLVPSISFELEDEKEQQEIFKTFRIDEFGAPREIVKSNDFSENKDERQDTVTNVDFSEDNPPNKQMEQYKVNAIYDGPSSYTAPQSSVGNLEARQVSQNNYNSRLEDLDENNSNGEGYPKERPARQFIF